MVVSEVRRLVVPAVAMVEIMAVEVSRTRAVVNYGAHYAIDYGDYSGGSGGFRDTSSRRTFEEYDAGDDDVVSTRRSNSLSARGPSSPAPPTKAKAPEPVPDLLGLDDDDFAAPAAPALASTAPAVSAPSVDRMLMPCFLLLDV